MTAYLIAEVEVTDAEKFAEYRSQVAATFTPYRGRFLASSTDTIGLEGEPPKGRIVIVEFPSLAVARAWWASEEYAAPKALRMQAARTRLIAVAGYD